MNRGQRQLSMTSSTTTPGSKIGRARRTLGQLWQVPAFLLGVLALLGVAASTPWRHTPQEREFEELVQSLRHGLDNEQPDGNTLVALAENAEIRLTEFPSRAAEVHFLIGSAYYRQAQQQSPAQALLLWPHAAEHLEQAAGRRSGSRQGRLAISARPCPVSARQGLGPGHRSHDARGGKGVRSALGCVSIAGQSESPAGPARWGRRLGGQPARS